MGGFTTPAGAKRSTGNMNNMKGQLGTRSSALAPTSSKLTTQYLVLDHMNNHYRKIVNAKSAIDNRVPKTMSTSQKARDRNTRDYVKKTGSRPVSRVSVNNMSRPHSQMYNYSDEEDIYNEGLWDDPEDDDEKLVYDIMRTTLKHNKEKGGSTNATYGGSSESRNNFDMSVQDSRMYDEHSRMPQGEVRRPLSTRSVHSATSSVYRTRRGGATFSRRGTYDGDMLQTRSHAFTEPEKPFTPRILKSTRSSKLAENKYYNPLPKKKEKSLGETGATDVDSTMEMTSQTPKPRPRPRTKSPHNRTETPLTDTTLMFESLQSRDFSKFDDDKEEVVPRLDISQDTDHLSWLTEQASKARIRKKSESLQNAMEKIKEDELSNSPGSRHNDLTMTSSTLGKSQTRTYGTKSLHDSQKLSNEEEELKYVEFVKEVTEDVLNRGVYTNRVLKQVFETHIRKRKGELNEDKMRLMLIDVRRELEIQDDDDDHRDNDHLNLTGSTIHTHTTSASSDSKFRLSNIPNRYTPAEQTRTFDSTLDSQNTFGLRSTESNMFSTIHSQPEELTATQALQSYQMDITHKEASEHGSHRGRYEQEKQPSESEDHQTRIQKKHRRHRNKHEKETQLSESEDDKTRIQMEAKSRVIRVSSNEQHDDEDARSTHSTLTQSTTSTLRRHPRSVENDNIPSPKPRSKALSQSGEDTAPSSSQGKMTQDESEDNEYADEEYEESGDELITSNRLSDDDF